MYVNIFQFLSTLTGSGEVERIAYNIGHVNSGALGNGLEFYPSDNQCGGNAFSVWRFVSSSARPYDYYMIFQHAGGSATGTNFGNTSASYGTYDTAFHGATSRGVLAWQIACSYDPVTFVATNPWNGTTNNDGTDSKGTPTWVTGSPGDTLAVLPQHNDNRTNKDHYGMWYFRGNTATPYGGAMDLMLETGTNNDGFYMNYLRKFSGTYTDTNNSFPDFSGYIGTYLPRSELTGTVVPLIGFGSTPNAAVNLFVEGSPSYMRSGSVGIWLSSSAQALFNLPLTRNTEIFTPTRNTRILNTFLRNAIEKSPIPLVASGANVGLNVGYVGNLSNNIALSYKPSGGNEFGSQPNVSFFSAGSGATIWFSRSSSIEDIYQHPHSISGSVTY